ncbi:hypothetical protein BMF35_a1890 [Aurantiacibacter gangjinensis]|nr:hypothetical protein BMF35_a1890 [Aurantiacibacter gangjinensis]
MVCGLALIVVIPTLWSTRKSDEYTLQLWTAGANAAFATCLFFFFFLALAQGTADAFPEWEANFIEFTDHAFDLTLLAFFLAFNIKRFTGAL